MIWERWTLGGHNEEYSTLYLNAINQVPLYKPWSLSFSYGRALQTSVLWAWKGEKNNGEQARKEFIRLIKVCRLVGTLVNIPSFLFF